MLTEQELKAIEAEAATYVGMQYVDYGDLSEQAANQIYKSYKAALTQERIKAKKLLDGLKQISESKFANDHIQVFAKALISEYNTKQIEP